MINDNGFMLSEILTRIGYPSYEAERIERECNICLSSEKVPDSILFVSSDAYLTGGKLYEELNEKLNCSEEEVENLERKLSESESQLEEAEEELKESRDDVLKLNEFVDYVKELTKHNNILFRNEEIEEKLKSKLYEVEDIY